MRRIVPGGRKLMIGATVLALMGCAYLAGHVTGYRAGLRDRGPDYRYLVVATKTAQIAGLTGDGYTLFDLHKPSDVARLEKEEARLKSIGVKYYITKGRIEWSVNPEPDPSRIDSHK